MRILYIYRSKEAGPSIRRVFEPIEKELSIINQVDSIYLPIETASPIDIYKNIKFVRKYLKDKKYDVIHVTGHVHYLAWVLRRYNTVVTVHDLGFYTKYSRGLKKRLLYVLFVYPLKYAKYVTYISDSSYKETNELLKLDKSKQAIIYDPVDSAFVSNSKTINQVCPTILHLGTKVNKNLSRVIEAVAKIPCKLHIIGNVQSELKLLIIKYHINAVIEANLSDQEMISAYKDCDIVCFPSLYEGFGMPIIEGQAIGRPVVTSNLSPMKEIAGNAAILVDPKSVESITKGIQQALLKSNSLIDRGFKNVVRFSVKKIAEEYYSVYNSIIK